MGISSYLLASVYLCLCIRIVFTFWKICVSKQYDIYIISKGRTKKAHSTYYVGGRG